jgi:hypothetical protein
MPNDNTVEIRIGAQLDSSLEASAKQAISAFDAIGASAAESFGAVAPAADTATTAMAQMATAAKQSAATAIESARQAGDEILSNDRIGSDEKLAAARAVWDQLLSGTQLTAQQRIQVERDEAEQESRIGQQATREAEEAARRALATDTEIARLQLEAKKQSLEQEVAAGELSKGQELEQLFELTEARDRATISQELSARSAVDFTTAAYAQMSDEIRKDYARLALDVAEYQRQIAASAAAMARDAAKSWEDANREVIGSEDQLVQGIFRGRETLGRLLEGLARDLVEKEIESDLNYWSERLLLDAEGHATEATGEKAGLLMRALMGQQETALTVEQAGAQMNAQVSAILTANAAKSAAQSEGMAQSIAMGSATIMNDASKAAASTYAAVAEIPIVGPFLAPAAAGAAFAAVAAYDTLTSAAGGQYQVLDDGQLTELHRNEMVMPASIADPMRGFFDGSLAGAREAAAPSATNHYHFNNSYNLSALDMAGMEGVMRRNSAQIMQHARNLARNQVRR